MKALTVCQPFAELIARGDKVIENRSRPTSYRGPLAIHAGLSVKWIEAAQRDRTMPRDIGPLILGAVVAVVEVYDCRALEALPPELRGNQHAHGPYCWLLRNVRRVSPIPAKGRLGLWTFPDL